MQQNIAHDLYAKQRTKDVILEESVNFISLLLRNDIQKGLAASGFKKPSPIQFKSIPLGRCGFDLVVKSKSGTGKTLVFSTVALEAVNVAKTQPQVLILVPTREIAVQIQDVIRNIGRYIDGLSVESFIGGLPLEEDIKKAKCCHIAVGAPGRVKHLINLGALSVKLIRLFVLDEADKLLEPSFQNDINEIYDSLPQRKQMIATSATYPKELDTFLTKYMQSPTHVTSENETPLLLGLKQFVAVLTANTINAVQQMRAKNEILLEIFSKVSFTQCLVFSNYQTRTESISNFLNQKGWDCSFISAASEQTQRLEALNNLKNFKNRILCSTDLTSRGIDAPNVDLVINYDVPHDAVTYLHRMGRAGRYGSAGICINFALEGSEITKLQNILGTIGSTNLSISKLPPLSENDLWQLDPNSLEQIWGVLPVGASNEVSENIKKEVFTLKQKNKENAKQKMNGNNNKKRKKKSKLEENNTFNEEKDKGENLEISNCSSLDSENILNSLISGTYSVDEEKQKKPKIEFESISKTENVENLLRNKKLEDGFSADSESFLTARSSNNNKKGETDIFNTKSSETVEYILKNKKTELEFEESLASVDSEELLSSLISGKCNDVIKKKNPILSSSRVSSKNMFACLVSNNENEKDRKGNLEEFTSTQKEELQDFSDVLDAENLFTSLLSLEEHDSRKDKRNSLDNFSVDKLKNESNYSTFRKNRALLSISKILSDIPTEIDLDSLESIDEYLKISKNESIEDCQVTPQEKISNIEDENLKLLKEEMILEEGRVDIIEDIFRIGYECIVLNDRKSWLACLPADELEKFQESCRSVSVPASSEEEEDEYLDDCEMDEYLEYEEEKMTQTGEENEVTNDDVQLQWVPVENSNLNIDHFAQCYDDCSNVLWQTGLTFETVTDFDNWFYHWQEHLHSVRNYIQQNIYVEEMSKYQQSRLNTK